MAILHSPFFDFRKEVLEAQNNRYVSQGFCIFQLPCKKYAVSHIYPRTVFAICDTLEETVEAINTAPAPEKIIEPPIKRIPLPKGIPYLDITDLDLGIK